MGVGVAVYSMDEADINIEKHNIKRIFYIVFKYVRVVIRIVRHGLTNLVSSALHSP